MRYAGVVTTPGIAYLTRRGPFVAGVMISASHNPLPGQRHQGFHPQRFQAAGREEHAIEQENLPAAGVGYRSGARQPSR